MSVKKSAKRHWKALTIAVVSAVAFAAVLTGVASPLVLVLANSYLGGATALAYTLAFGVSALVCSAVAIGAVEIARLAGKKKSKTLFKGKSNEQDKDSDLNKGAEPEIVQEKQVAKKKEKEVERDKPNKVEFNNENEKNDFNGFGVEEEEIKKYSSTEDSPAYVGTNSDTNNKKEDDKPEKVVTNFEIRDGELFHRGKKAKIATDEKQK